MQVGGKDVLPQLAKAAEDVYDYSTTTSDAVAATTASGLAIGLIMLWVVAVAIGLAFLIWWIVLIVDLVNRDFPEKSTWMIVMILGFVLGFLWLACILYYFMVVKKNLGSKKSVATTAPPAK